MEQDEDFLSVQAVKVTLSQPALQVCVAEFSHGVKIMNG